MEGAMEGGEDLVCLYGAACHPDMDQLVAAHKGRCLPGKDCVAAFLPDEQRRELERRKAFVMTRTGDDYLGNSDRYTFCNAEEATILISVHTNSVVNPDWDGSMTWPLSATAKR